MGKTIDISKINLSAKGIALLIVGIVIFIALWHISNWVFAKVSGGTKTVSSPFKMV